MAYGTMKQSMKHVQETLQSDNKNSLRTRQPLSIAFSWPPQIEKIMIVKSKRYAIDKVIDLSTVLHIKRITSPGILPCHRGI
jgi:hypothetical protein